MVARVERRAEIEVGFDYDLHYEWVIGAITAVSGTKDVNGNVVRLIEKIRFNTPESPAGIESWRVNDFR